jgi:alkanesulfonate monooxygenase SsuD/methylene tetrahydromethanopterin reductase-like flavin-dependent oxidoreductase (luciferase family)
MLRLTARHADAWNTAWVGTPDQQLRSQLTALDAALATEGREGRSIRRTVGVEVSNADGRVAQTRIARLFEEYSRLTVDDVFLVLQPMTVQSLDRLGDAIETWRAGVLS